MCVIVISVKEIYSYILKNVRFFEQETESQKAGTIFTCFSFILLFLTVSYLSFKHHVY